MLPYIYDYPNWPHFTWDDKGLTPLLGEVRNLQGRVVGQMSLLGFASREEANLSTLTQDIVHSFEIEGEKLDAARVRSSVAHKLGVNTAGLVAPSRYVDGVVEMMLDATQHHNSPLTHDRLCSWHAALFPTGHSAIRKIEVGTYRTGEMQIVSGAMGREVIHFEAISADRLKPEMDTFLHWFNDPTPHDLVLKAAIAHFWFIIIHPFEDGNGRIARALTDLLLARSDGMKERFYSMSSQIHAERKLYYAVLQKVQHSNGDLTEWVEWFLNCLKRSLLSSDAALSAILNKARFWAHHESTPLNERQRTLIHKLLGDFEGKLTTSKWAKLAKCSSDTALRDIKDLLQKEILVQQDQGGRSTHYVLAPF